MARPRGPRPSSRSSARWGRRSRPARRPLRRLATTVGVGFLVTLLFLFNVGAAGWAKTLSAILAFVGFSLAGLTGTLKNSAQALLKRLRQDAYTDLVAQAVLIAPPPPSKSAVQDAIRRRGLTPATPN